MDKESYSERTVCLIDKLNGNKQLDRVIQLLKKVPRCDHLDETRSNSSMIL